MEKIIYFKLFATCIIVKGASTSLIYDLERIAFYDLSNSFLDILKLSKTKSISEIKTIYNNADDKLIDSFFAQFVSELRCPQSRPKNLKCLYLKELHYHYPFTFHERKCVNVII